jgi:hypothetical protein
VKRLCTTAVKDEKQSNITYSDGVTLALGTQHAMRMRHIIIGDLPYSTQFLHFIS